jgi:hypothetical protein
MTRSKRGGRGGGTGANNSNNSNKASNGKSATPQQPSATTAAVATTSTSTSAAAPIARDQCIVCCNDIFVYSIGACNHPEVAIVQILSVLSLIDWETLVDRSLFHIVVVLGLRSVQRSSANAVQGPFVSDVQARDCRRRVHVEARRQVRIVRLDEAHQVRAEPHVL